MINTNLMTENVKNDRMGATMCQLDITKDLACKTSYNDNSWFAVGRYEVEGHVINMLFHLMEMKLPILGGFYQSVVTVFDETTGFYYAKDYLYRPKQVEIHDKDFFIKVPNGSMSGDWDKMKIQVSEGDIHVDIEATAIHYPILIGGNSVIDICDMCIHEFSVPRMVTKGTITVDGKKYDITDKGYTWFDRQWQNINYMHSTMKWSWMAIQLDSGEIFSIFDTNLPGKEDNVLAMLEEDGTQINLRHIPAFVNGEKEYWQSEKSKQKYPVKWDLEIPQLDAQFEIIPIKKEQEIVSTLGELNKYEGNCTVSGMYKGRKVTGHALVELIGHWNER